MKENIGEFSPCFCNTHPSVHCFHLTDLDPITRRVEKPANLTDIQFYDRLKAEANLLINGDADLAMCMCEQAYEVARDKGLGVQACLFAAFEPYQRGFFDIAFKMFEEMTQRALAEKDIQTLRTLKAFLNQFGGFVQGPAIELAAVIVERHPEVLKPRRNQRSH
jgi:hypothetical protein